MLYFSTFLTPWVTFYRVFIIGPPLKYGAKKKQKNSLIFILTQNLSLLLRYDSIKLRFGMWQAYTQSNIQIICIQTVSFFDFVTVTVKKAWFIDITYFSRFIFLYHVGIM